MWSKWPRKRIRNVAIKNEEEYENEYEDEKNAIKLPTPEVWMQIGRRDLAHEAVYNYV